MSFAFTRTQHTHTLDRLAQHRPLGLWVFSPLSITTVPLVTSTLCSLFYTPASLSKSEKQNWHRAALKKGLRVEVGGSTKNLPLKKQNIKQETEKMAAKRVHRSVVASDENLPDPEIKRNSNLNEPTAIQKKKKREMVLRVLAGRFKYRSCQNASHMRSYRSNIPSKRKKIR